jgi:hypothetical protein
MQQREKGVADSIQWVSDALFYLPQHKDSCGQRCCRVGIEVIMTGLQIAVSCLMSFFFPGLGQLYQGLFDPARTKVAFALVLALAVCLLSVIGIAMIPVVWIFSFGECIWWAVQKTGLPQPANSAAKSVAVLLAIGLACSAAKADTITGRWEFVRADNAFAFVPDAAAPGLATPDMKLPCEGGACPNTDLRAVRPPAYVDDSCDCTALRNCRSALCQRGATKCIDCPCHERGDDGRKGACGPGNACGAQQWNRSIGGPARRGFWRSCRRGGCR